MHDVARDSNAQSPRVVPGVAGRARVRVRRPGRWLAFSGQSSSAQKLPAVPVGRSENNAMLAEAAFASSIATPRRG